LSFIVTHASPVIWPILPVLYAGDELDTTLTGLIPPKEITSIDDAYPLAENTPSKDGSSIGNYQ
jgi:hypothetical protein